MNLENVVCTEEAYFLEDGYRAVKAGESADNKSRGLSCFPVSHKCCVHTRGKRWCELKGFGGELGRKRWWSTASSGKCGGRWSWVLIPVMEVGEHCDCKKAHSQIMLWWRGSQLAAV